MSIPLVQTYRVGRYILEQKLRGVKRYPLVLMLEPLFRCNLACPGCGKIDYEDDILNRRLTAEQCLQAVDECGGFRSPLVSAGSINSRSNQPSSYSVVVINIRPRFNASLRLIALHAPIRNLSCPASSNQAAFAVALSNPPALSALLRITRPHIGSIDRLARNPSLGCAISSTLSPAQYRPTPRISTNVSSIAGNIFSLNKS